MTSEGKPTGPLAPQAPTEEGSGGPPQERERKRIPPLDEGVRTVEPEQVKIAHSVLAKFFEEMAGGWSGTDPRVAVLLRTLSTKIFRYLPGGAKQLAEERLATQHQRFLRRTEHVDMENAEQRRALVSSHHEAQKPFLILNYLVGHGILFVPDKNYGVKPAEARKAPDLYPTVGSDFHINMRLLEQHARNFLEQLEARQADPSAPLEGNVFADIFADRYYFGKMSPESAFENLYAAQLKPDLEGLRAEEHRTKSEIARAAFRKQILERLRGTGIKNARIDIELEPGVALPDGSIEFIVKEIIISDPVFTEGSRRTTIPEDAEGWDQFKDAVVRSLRLQTPPSDMPFVSWISFAPDFKFVAQQRGVEAGDVRTVGSIERRDFGLSEVVSSAEALERLKAALPPFPAGKKPHSRSITFRRAGKDIGVFIDGVRAPKEAEEAALLYFRSVSGGSDGVRTALFLGRKYLVQYFATPEGTWHGYFRGGEKTAKKYLTEKRPDYVEPTFPDGSIILQDTEVAVVRGQAEKRNLLTERARMRAERIRDTMNQVIGGLLASVDEVRIGAPTTNESEQHAKMLELFTKFVALRAKQRMRDIVHNISRAENLAQAKEWTGADLAVWAADEAKRLGKRAAVDAEQTFVIEAAKTLGKDGAASDPAHAQLIETLRELVLRRNQNNYLEQLERIDRAMNGLFGSGHGVVSVGEEGVHKMRESVREYLSALRRDKVKELPEGENFVKTFCGTYLGIAFSKELLDEAGLLKAIQRVEERLAEKEAEPIRNEVVLTAEELATLDRMLAEVGVSRPAPGPDASKAEFSLIESETRLATIRDQMQVLEHAFNRKMWDAHPRFKSFEDYLAIIEKDLVLYNQRLGSLMSEIDSLTASLLPRQTDGALLPWGMVLVGNIAAEQRQEALRIYTRIITLKALVEREPLIVKESRLMTMSGELSPDQERIRDKKALIRKAIAELFENITDPQTGGRKPEVTPEVDTYVHNQIAQFSQALAAVSESADEKSLQSEPLLDSALAVIKELESE